MDLPKMVNNRKKACFLDKPTHCSLILELYLKVSSYQKT